jgi:hypothetical protein
MQLNRRKAFKFYLEMEHDKISFLMNKIFGSVNGILTCMGKNAIRLLRIFSKYNLLIKKQIGLEQLILYTKYINICI